MIRIRRTISATLISGLTAHENYDILNKKIAYTVGSLVRNILYLRVDGNRTTSFLYNSYGIRIRKTVGDTITEYFTSGSTILAEKLTNTADETVNDIIWYIYDSDGDLLGFTYNGTPYYYVKNVQGDVYKVVDASGNVVASYTYAYTKEVAVPSVTLYWLNKQNKLQYDYYSYPWEAEADNYGGVKRKYDKPMLPEGAYNSYWDLITMFWE